MTDEVYFCYADKHWSVIQVDTIILGVHRQACPKYQKPRSLHIFAISAEKPGGQSVFFACW